MSKGISISAKHGVNPTMGVCFWCGGDSGDIGLVGRLPGDKEAPKSAVLSYEPCGKCKERKTQGITMIEAREEPCLNGQPSMHRHREVYPTGRWMVIRERAIEHLLNDPEQVAKVLRTREAYVECEAYERLRLMFEEAGGEDGNNKEGASDE